MWIKILKLGKPDQDGILLRRKRDAPRPPTERRPQRVLKRLALASRHLSRKPLSETLAQPIPAPYGGPWRGAAPPCGVSWVHPSRRNLILGLQVCRKRWRYVARGTLNANDLQDTLEAVRHGHVARDIEILIALRR